MKDINIENVSKSFGKNKVLENINVTFEENKITGLLGRNGVGKTTLFNLITDRIFADSGSITAGGQKIAGNDDMMPKIFMMDQVREFASYRVCKMLELYKMLLENFDLVYALELAKKFDLNLKLRYQNLSTGYKNILKIIVSFASNAEVIFYDEPVLGLDAGYRTMFYKELLANVAERPKTVVISTHIIEEISHLLENAVILADERVLYSGSVEALMEKSFTVSGASDKMKAMMSGKKYFAEEKLGNLTKCMFFDSLENKDFQYAKQQALDIAKPDLQTIFVQLTEGGHKNDECN